MISADLFDSLDYIAQSIRGPHNPPPDDPSSHFGGIQVIACVPASFAIVWPLLVLTTFLSGSSRVTARATSCSSLR